MSSQDIDQFRPVSQNGKLDIVTEEINIKTYQFPTNYDHHQSPIKANPCYIFKYRIFIVLVTIVVTIVGEMLTIPTDTTLECINDPIHNLTDPVNSYINSNETFAHLLQIISSFLLDISFFSVTIYWLFHTRTFRFFFALLIFYGIRFVHLQLLQMRFAPGYYWDDPGVPSLVVKYGWLSDFFYSGHCGFLFLCALEWRKVGKNTLFYLTLLASFYQAFVVTVFRIHYTIDVPGGFVYSHWIYRLTCDYEVQIDYYNKMFIDSIIFVWNKSIGRLSLFRCIPYQMELVGEKDTTPTQKQNGY